MNINVRFIENVPRKRMKGLYSAHDIMVLPSNEEAIGMVVLEAIACGLPVIVSDTVGAKMYVDEDNGKMFKTFDCDNLAYNICMCVERFDMNIKLKDEYNIKNVAKRFDEFIGGKSENEK